MERAKQYQAIYAPPTAIRIWQSASGWSADFPEGTNERVKDEVSKLLMTLGQLENITSTL